MIDRFKSLILQNIHVVLSIAWLILIVFFTYTPLVHFALKSTANTSFISEYSNHQYCGIALIVNLGLLIMVIFDYIGANKKVSVKLLVSVLVAVALIIGIYLHVGAYVANTLWQYIYPIKSHSLSIVFHVLFLLIVLSIKTKSMESNKINVNTVKDCF